MLRWGRLEVTGGFCLAAAALFYLDTENILPWALLACALHESGHYAVTRLAGGGVAYFRLTAVGGDLGLDPARPLGYAGEMAAILAGPTVNLLCASLCARLGDGADSDPLGGAGGAWLLRAGGGTAADGRAAAIGRRRWKFYAAAGGPLAAGRDAPEEISKEERTKEREKARFPVKYACISRSPVVSYFGLNKGWSSALPLHLTGGTALKAA